MFPNLLYAFPPPIRIPIFASSIALSLAKILVSKTSKFILSLLPFNSQHNNTCVELFLFLKEYAHGINYDFDENGALYYIGTLGKKIYIEILMN